MSRGRLPKFAKNATAELYRMRGSTNAGTDFLNSAGVLAPCYNDKLRKGADLLPMTLIYCL